MDTRSTHREKAMCQYSKKGLQAKERGHTRNQLCQHLDLEFPAPRIMKKYSSLVAQLVKNPPAVWETWVGSLCPEEPLEVSMAIHSSILAWRIPWTEEPGRLQPIGSQRVRHDWSDWALKWYLWMNIYVVLQNISKHVSGGHKRIMIYIDGFFRKE